MSAPLTLTSNPNLDPDQMKEWAECGNSTNRSRVTKMLETDPNGGAPDPLASMPADPAVAAERLERASKEYEEAQAEAAEAAAAREARCRSTHDDASRDFEIEAAPFVKPLRNTIAEDDYVAPELETLCKDRGAFSIWSRLPSR